MCIIIYSDPSLSLKKDHIINSMKSNPHGIGFAYWRAGEPVRWQKGIFKEIPQTLLACMEDPDMHVVFHARFATHGDITPGLCHPFLCSPYRGRGRMKQEGELKEGEFLLFHNGVFSVVDKVDPTESDTSLMARVTLALIRELGALTAVDVLAELGGKIAIVDHEGTLYYSGLDERDGVLASNSSHVSPPGVYVYDWGYGRWRLFEGEEDKAITPLSCTPDLPVHTIDELEDYVEERGYMLIATEAHYTWASVEELAEGKYVFLDYVEGREDEAIRQVLNLIK